jgi:hypothetical protein
MRHDKLLPGAILITIGVIFLLKSFGLIHIHWINLLHLWPIFLVIGGINLIFAHNRSPWASVLKIGVVIAGVLILLFGNFNDRFNFWPHTYYNYRSDDNNDNNDNNNDGDDDDDNDNKGVVKVEGNSTFSEPFHAEAAIAKLNISGGATSYQLSDTTNQLFEAYTKEHGGKYVFSHSLTDSVAVLNFKMNSQTRFFSGKNKSNKATLKLNSNPIWDMDISVGAANIDFDLTKFKIRNLTFNGGAAACDIKLGQPLENTKIDVSTGAADVHIRIPKNAACKIVSDSGLSSEDFEGFTKTSDNHYETAGFAAAKNKISIKLDGAFTGFKVTRY